VDDAWQCLLLRSDHLCYWTRTSPSRNRATSVPIKCKRLFYKGYRPTRPRTARAMTRWRPQSVTPLLRQADARSRRPVMDETRVPAMGADCMGCGLAVGVPRPPGRCQGESRAAGKARNRQVCLLFGAQPPGAGRVAGDTATPDLARRRRVHPVASLKPQPARRNGYASAARRECAWTAPACYRGAAGAPEAAVVALAAAGVPGFTAALPDIGLGPGPGCWLRSQPDSIVRQSIRHGISRAGTRTRTRAARAVDGWPFEVRIT